jgi:hypothetical protein
MPLQHLNFRLRFAAGSGGKEKSMPAQQAEPTPRSFVELLRHQIDALKNGKNGDVNRPQR